MRKKLDSKTSFLIHPEPSPPRTKPRQSGPWPHPQPRGPPRHPLACGNPPCPRISAAPFPASGIRLPDAPSLHTCHCSSVTLSERPKHPAHLKYQPCSLSVPSLCSRFCPDTFPLSNVLVACRLSTLETPCKQRLRHFCVLLPPLRTPEPCLPEQTLNKQIKHRLSLLSR